jgi:phytoene dehydrogenase-like protein
LPEPLYDAVIVGSGPNGLAAAVVMAEAGRSVLVVEAADQIGGGTRSEPLTLPGYVHDVCSTIHALALASPLLRDLPLDRHGLDLIQPDVPLAHPLDGGRAVVLERSVERTAARLGDHDGRAYRSLMDPLVNGADGLFADVLGPARPPRHPLTVATFARGALRSAWRTLASTRTRPARSSPASPPIRTCPSRARRLRPSD